MIGTMFGWFIAGFFFMSGALVFILMPFVLMVGIQEMSKVRRKNANKGLHNSVD